MNYDLMKKICLAKVSEFETLGEVTQTKDGIYIHKQAKDAKILGVAHLDSVLDLNHFYKLDIGGREIVMNAQLDDRLGVYVMLDILPRMGVKFDLLLTEGEESGQSTAAYFETSKEYNWMFSFDRRGEDIVLYQYDDIPTRQALQDSKFKVGIGSFSDIAFLEHLGIKGFNIGTGYEGEHSEFCYAEMDVLERQVKRFVHFYQNNKDIHMPHTQKASPPAWYREYFEEDTCYLCGKQIGIHEIDSELYLCDFCFNDAGQCQECYEIFYDNQLHDGLCEMCLKIDSE